MEIPHRGARPSAALPEIYVQDPNRSDRFRTSSRSSSYNSNSSPSTSSIPMPIPNARDPVPPPLPPPRHIADLAGGKNNGQDIAWKWGNSHRDSSDWETSISTVPPSSSLSGNSFASRKFAERPVSRRESSTSTIKSASGADPRENAYTRDEGYESLSSGASIWQVLPFLFY